MSRRDRRARVVDVDIEAFDEDGLGIARRPHADLHVKGVVPGESAQVHVLSRRGPSRLGVPMRWQRASPQRVTPPCASFMACGGCSLQHVSVGDQLALKERWLFAHLALAGVEVETHLPPVSGPRLLYRRKARLSGRYLADSDEFLLGFHESFSAKVARLLECKVLEEPFSSGFPELRNVLGGLSIVHLVPQVEIAVGDDSSAVVIRHLEPLSAADARRLRTFASDLRTTVLLQGDSPATPRTLDGEAPALLRYRLDAFGVLLEFAALDFVQVNRVVNERLVAAAVGALDPRANEAVLDLFCGIGNFTLPLARRGAIVTGVDATTDAVDRARHNARLNGLTTRISVTTRDLYAAPLGDALGNTKVLVDPPRSGLGRCLPTLFDPRIERVCYVSCEPRTFALDASALVHNGYRLARCGVFDMFPHTAHVETLGVFERR